MPFIEVTLIEGRDPAAPRAMTRRITDAVVETIAAPRESVRIVLREVPPAHLAVAGEPKG